MRGSLSPRERAGVRGNGVPAKPKGSHNKDAHLHSPPAAQYTGGHDSTVLGKGPRQHRRELEAQEVVTICDHQTPSHSTSVNITARTSMTCFPGTVSARKVSNPRPLLISNVPSRSGLKSFT
jgi:hypothetical protein